MSAMARPLNEIDAAVEATGQRTKRLEPHPSFLAGVPLGSRAPATIASANPPLDAQAETGPAGGGPLKKRP